MTESPPPSRRTVAAVVAVAAVLRLSVVLTAPDDYSLDRIGKSAPDGPRYVVLARHLAAGDGFGKRQEDGLVHVAVERVQRGNGSRPPASAAGVEPEGFRTPGYPLFLLACGAAEPRRAVFVQCLLGAFAAGLAVGFATRLGFGRRAAVAVGLLVAAHPGFVVSDNLVLTETPFAVLGLAGLALAARPPTAGNRLAAGLLLAAASLVRPIGFLYLPSALLLGRPFRWRAAAVLTAAALLPPAAWAGRNLAVGFGPRVSTVGEVNLYFYAVSYLRSERAGEDLAAAWPRRVDELADELAAGLRPGEDVYAAMRRAAVRELAADPGTTAKVVAKSEAKLLLDHSLGPVYAVYHQEWQPTGVFSDLLAGRRPAGGLTGPPLLAVGWSLLNAAVAGLAAVGAVRLVVRRHGRLTAALVLPVLLFSAATFPVGLERFRLPFLVYLLVLAVAAVAPPVRRPG